MQKLSGTLEKNINISIELQHLSKLECPIIRAMEVIGDKYSILIILNLLEKEKQRFIELENAIPGISPRTLSARLKHLEKHEIINRKQYQTIPPKVEYSLTDKGQKFISVIDTLKYWAETCYPYQVSN